MRPTLQWSVVPVLIDKFLTEFKIKAEFKNQSISVKSSNKLLHERDQNGSMKLRDIS